MRSSLRVALFSLALTLAVQDVVLAQASRSRSICFRGRPQPPCHAFWITEIGYYSAFAKDGLEEIHASAEVGLMANRGRSARGALLSIGYSEFGHRAGILGRHRRWLNEQTTLDLTAGVANVQAPFSSRAATGVSGDIALGWADVGQVAIRADLVRSKGRTGHGFYLGGRVGSYPAVVVAVISGLLFAVVRPDQMGDF